MGGMIKCLECELILHSLYRHDFKACDCSNHAFVDGGFDYERIGAHDFDKVEVVKHKHTKIGKYHSASLLEFTLFTDLMEDERKAYNLKKENQNDGKATDSDNN